MHSVTFDRLFRKTRDNLYRLAFRVLRHREDAEDVVQDAFLALVEAEATGLGRIRPRALASRFRTLVRRS